MTTEPTASGNGHSRTRPARDATAGGGPPVTGDHFAGNELGTIERAFLRAGGLSKEEVRRRPIIGICSSWSELNPCNMGLRDLAEAVRCNELNAAYAADGYARIQGVGAVCTTFGWANSPR